MGDTFVLIGEVRHMNGTGEPALGHVVRVDASSSREPLPAARIGVQTDRAGSQPFHEEAWAVLDDEALSTLIEYLIDARARMRGDYLRQTVAPEKP